MAPDMLKKLFFVVPYIVAIQVSSGVRDAAGTDPTIRITFIGPYANGVVKTNVSTNLSHSIALSKVTSNNESCQSDVCWPCNPSCSADTDRKGRTPQQRAEQCKNSACYLPLHDGNLVVDRASLCCVQAVVHANLSNGESVTASANLLIDGFVTTSCPEKPTDVALTAYPDRPYNLGESISFQLSMSVVNTFNGVVYHNGVDVTKSSRCRPPDSAGRTDICRHVFGIQCDNADVVDGGNYTIAIKTDAGMFTFTHNMSPNSPCHALNCGKSGRCAKTSAGDYYCQCYSQHQGQFCQYTCEQSHNVELPYWREVDYSCPYNTRLECNCTDAEINSVIWTNDAGKTPIARSKFYVVSFEAVEKNVRFQCQVHGDIRNTWDVIARDGARINQTLLEQWLAGPINASLTPQVECPMDMGTVPSLQYRWLAVTSNNDPDMLRADCISASDESSRYAYLKSEARCGGAYMCQAWNDINKDHVVSATFTALPVPHTPNDTSNSSYIWMIVVGVLGLVLTIGLALIVRVRFCGNQPRSRYQEVTGANQLAAPTDPEEDESCQRPGNPAGLLVNGPASGCLSSPDHAMCTDPSNSPDAPTSLPLYTHVDPPKPTNMDREELLRGLETLDNDGKGVPPEYCP